MFEVYRKEVQWGGRTLTLETGKMARQADGAVVARYGDTVVLCTVVAAKSPRPGIDFFPLSVHYQEKTFAAGKIPGGFFKREGRPTEKEVLTSRLIDRPIRPLFVKGFKNETQVICTVLAHDLENDPDIVAMVGSSAALCISGVPFLGPIGGCRVGYKDGEYLLNPSMDQVKESDLDLVVAGTQEGVLMVESMASELSEEVMLGAVNFGHDAFQPIIQAIIELAEACAKDPMELPAAAVDTDALRAKLEAACKADLEAAYDEPNKTERQNKVGAAKEKAIASLEDAAEIEAAKGVLKDLESDIVRGRILETGQRIDGRDTKTVRPIVAEVGVLPRTHGSALFTRRRDPGDRGHHAGHRPGRADHRRARGRVPRALHAALQLPAVLGGRGRPHGLAGPSRDRPRQAGVARHPAADAVEGQLPVHRPRGLRDHRVERLVLDGHGLRHLAVDDGRRRAVAAAGGGHRHGPDQGGREVRGALRHPR